VLYQFLLTSFETKIRIIMNKAKTLIISEVLHKICIDDGLQNNAMRKKLNSRTVIASFAVEIQELSIFCKSHT